MTLLTMTIPDDPAELPRWLERRLMAPDFGRFVAELSAHFPTDAGKVQPRHLLDRWLPVALAEGLAPVPPDVLSQLLRHPAGLAAFQERVVTDGGAYWDDVPDAADDVSKRVEHGKRALDQVLAAGPLAKPGLRATPSGAMKRTGARGYQLWAAASTAVAACLVVAVVCLTAGRLDAPPVLKSQLAWGWAKPGGLALDQSTPKGYLDRLAANAEEWAAYRPGDPDGVGTRLAEFRLGCTRLMHSASGPLAPPDKPWLSDRCREWARALDGHQQALDAGADPLAVRDAVDDLVRDIARALRERATQVG
jgi:hypothetical protein